MSEMPQCHTNADVLALIKRSGRDYDIIARTIYGLEIACVRTGGEKKPSILITAGAHAGEPAGVLAALSLINTLDTEHAVYIVPLRDPFGWGGFARCLGLALGEEVIIESHDDAERLLSERGSVLYTEKENSLIISLIGDLVFVTIRPAPGVPTRRALERGLKTLMSDRPELASVLVGKRVCWPSNRTEVEGCGDFDRAFSSFVTPQGVMADLNRQFTFAYPPVEVACVRDLIDKERPALVLDLHEGVGSQFYLFTSTYRKGDSRARIVAAIAKAILKRGDELYRLSDLVKVFPELSKRLKEPVAGLMVGAIEDPGQGASFGAYSERHGPAFTLESGMYKPLAERVAQTVAGALAAISEFERQHQT